MDLLVFAPALTLRSRNLIMPRITSTEERGVMQSKNCTEQFVQLQLILKFLGGVRKGG